MALPNRKVNKPTESKPIENNTNVENNNAELQKIKSVDTRSSKSLVNSFDSFSKNFNS